ncbi:MAG: hypothetical protein DBY41_07070 [Clostridium sp.]|nr:MAG: hypothetical protein DBY41_07070 [Clostridium sp.]RHP77512.1 hypothetical protein DXA62_02655 [Coprobacillus sp. OF03-2AA]
MNILSRLKSTTTYALGVFAVFLGFSIYSVLQENLFSLCFGGFFSVLLTLIYIASLLKDKE